MNSELAQLHHASAHHLPMVESGSVQAIVTSPPYFGLRKYEGEQDIEWPEVTYSPLAGLEPITVAGCDPECEHEWEVTTAAPKSGGRGEKSPYQNRKGNSNFQEVPPVQTGTCQKCGGWRGPLGNEPTIEAYIAHLVLCAREWRRVLREDGVCFVNLGDSYGSGTSAPRQKSRTSTKLSDAHHNAQAGRNGQPAKNRLMIPARFALAMQADGWILRDEWVWHKPNPMPESVTDRATKAHEMIYVFSKRERYFWDADAVREPHTWNGTHKAMGRGTQGYAVASGVNSRPQRDSNGGLGQHPNGRNLRSVLTVATQPYAQAHFAVWPAALVEPMIKAGSRPGDVVMDPFSGSGTTGRVAIQLGRRYVGIDLSQEYLDTLAPDRLTVQMEMAAL